MSSIDEQVHIHAPGTANLAHAWLHGAATWRI